MQQNSDAQGQKKPLSNTPEHPHYMRKIRSFVLREGRLTKAQAQAMESQWPLYGLQLSIGLLDFQSLFNRDKPTETVLEIGFGMGDSLIQMAQAEPEKNFIGIEVHTPGVGALLIQIQALGIENIRIFKCDAIEVLAQCIPDHSLARVQVYFPDPWHKKRHHKRRIIQVSFIETVHKKLQKDGLLHMATDWENYAEHMLEVMQTARASALYENTSTTNDYLPRPEWRPVTKFEKRGLRLGHGIWDLIFKTL